MPRLTATDFRVLVRVFEKNGFSFVRQRGDHRVYTRIGVRRPLVIPALKAVPVFVIRNLLRTAGKTREEYFRLRGSGEATG
jgi:predicted RNA binding protein YcfA (HicA-like mRNA interferase family)